MPQEPNRLVKTEEYTKTYYDVVSKNIRVDVLVTGRIVAGDNKITYEVRATGYKKGNERKAIRSLVNDEHGYCLADYVTKTAALRIARNAPEYLQEQSHEWELVDIVPKLVENAKIAPIVPPHYN